jgi:putative ABC transport system permease protein
MRQWGRAPGFAITAILTLALGIGANSTILSWISATLFNPIPAAKNVDRMLSIQRGERSEHPTPPLSYPDFVDLRANDCRAPGRYLACLPSSWFHSQSGLKHNE